MTTKEKTTNGMENLAITEPQEKELTVTETQARTKGWPPKRRAEYAERIRKNRIWRFSTGPRTREGKARSCQNAVSHGCYTGEWQIVRLALLAQRQHLHRLKQWVKVLNIQHALVDHIHIRYADHLAPDIFFGNTAAFWRAVKG